jgi:hypothetical protein
MEKKAYSAPDAEPFSIDEGAIDAVSGGFELKSEEELHAMSSEERMQYFIEAHENGLAGVYDVFFGEGRGGGCDGVSFHRFARTFSSGRNSGC